MLAHPPESPDLDVLKKQHCTDDEDELIYRAFLPQSDIDAMRAAGPVKQDFPLLSSPELDQVRKLMQLADVPLIQVRSETMDLTLRR